MNNRLNDIIKYVIVLGILYIILKKIPSKKMSDSEIATLLFIIMIIFITIDYNCFKNNFELFTDNSNIFSDPSLSNSERLRLYLSGETVAPAQPSDITEQKATTKQATQATQATTKPIQAPIVKTTLNPTIACDLEIDKIKQEMNLQMQTQISELKTQMNNNPNNSNIEQKYYNSLILDLLNMKLLTDSDVQNIDNKIKLKLLTLPEIITSLETLKSSRTSSQVDNSDNKFNELPSGFFTPVGDKIANNWDNDYAILDTKLWTVPMQKPPLCVSNSPSNVSPSNYSNVVNLKEWDNSRVVSNTQINKAWVNKQVLT